MNVTPFPGRTEWPEPGAPIPAEAPVVFPLANLIAWAQIEPEPRQWALDRLIPEGEVTLFTGAGGAGKSLFAQQLATCFAVGRPMLGVATAGGSALYITAEDDDRELHWRQAAICRSLHVPIAALAGKLHLASLRGRPDNELATFDAEGRLRPGAALAVLRATIRATGAKLLFLDNVAHLFLGNENDRGQVTAFANLLSGLCREFGLAIVLIGHPNKAGDDYSGSTAWLNAVRSQMTLRRPADHSDPDVRELVLGKANYARQGEALTFRWHAGALVRDEDLPADTAAEIATAATAAHDNAVFLACLAETSRRNVAVSENVASRTYGPLIFSRMQESKGIGRARLEAALDRLYRLDKVERGFLWRADRKDRFGLREKCADVRADPAPTGCADVRRVDAPTCDHTHSPYYVRGSGAFDGPPDSDPYGPDDLDWGDGSEAAE